MARQEENQSNIMEMLNGTDRKSIVIRDRGGGNRGGGMRDAIQTVLKGGWMDR